MPRSGNLECIIEMTAGKLQEYPCSEPDPDGYKNSQTVYVHAMKGEFKIKLIVHNGENILPEADMISFRIYLDGAVPDNLYRFTRRLEAESSTVTRISHGSISRRGDGTSSGIMHFYGLRYTFGAVNTVQRSYRANVPRNMVKKLGEIKVLVYRAKYIGPDLNLQGINAVAEGAGDVKAVRGEPDFLDNMGIDLAVKLGRQYILDERQMFPWKVKHIDKEEEPYMVFRFLYRSERVLEAFEALGVIELTPEPLSRAVSADSEYINIHSSERPPSSILDEHEEQPAHENSADTISTSNATLGQDSSSLPLGSANLSSPEMMQDVEQDVRSDDEQPAGESPLNVEEVIGMSLDNPDSLFKTPGLGENIERVVFGLDPPLEQAPDFDRTGKDEMDEEEYFGINKHILRP